MKKNYGSYRYKGNWQTIDHLILSGALLDGHSVWKADRRLTVFSASFLLEEIKLISDTNLVLLTGDRVMSVDIAIIYRYISI